MRRLAIFAGAYAAATAVYVWLLRGIPALISAGVLAIAGIVLLFFRSDHAERLRIGAFGAAVGLLWCWGYEQWKLEPLRALAGTERTITATVCDYPSETRYGSSVEVRLDGGRALLYLRTEQPELMPGDTVTVRAELTDVSGASTEESFVYQSRDISLLAFQRGKLSVQKAEAVPLRELPRTVLHAVQTKLDELFPEDTAPFVKALLTGDRSGLSYELKNDLSVSGVSHVVAVSGLHVSMLAGFVMLLCLRRRRLAAVVSIAVMFFFAAMLGFTPSVTRAALMNTVLLLAPILKRENDAPTTLSFSLMVILAGNPWAIASLSLQLSFAAMAGVFLFAPPIYKWLMTGLHIHALREKLPLLYRLLRTGAASLSTSLGATVMTAPLAAASFGVFSVVAPLTNLLVLNLIGWVFTGCFAALLLGFLFAPLGRCAAWLLSWGVRLVLWIVGRMADIPYAALYTEQPYVIFWLVAAYVLIVLYLLLRKRCRPRFLLLGLTVTLAATVLFCRLDGPDNSVTMLDVGQGQCILMHNGGINVLVDCGGDDGDTTGELAARKLLMRGDTRLDALILTHFDTDHVGGVRQLMNRVEVCSLLVPDIPDDSGNREEILKLAEEHGVPVTFVRENTVLEFSGGTVTLYAPGTAFSDNDGLAALMSPDGYDILVTGDMNLEAENRLLSRQELPDVDVLVAGHHGSKYASGERLLTAVSPEVVLISVGENTYGHPTQETLDRIAASGALVFRTDLDGDITISR